MLLSPQLEMGLHDPEQVNKMKIDEVANILKATVHHIPENYDVDIVQAGAADLMSDVLAYVQRDMLLITGLNTIQVIRTASVMDITAIVFTRGKVPTHQMIEEAKSSNITILSTDYKTYTTCGLLYSSGVMSIDGESPGE